MRLRYHLLILSAIAVATVIFFPLPFFLMIFVLLGEGLLYGWLVMPIHSDRKLQGRRRRGIGR